MGRWNRRTSTGDPESGSLIVDAAVCLPIFLIAAGLLMLLLMQAGTEDTVVRAAADASLTCVEAAAGMEAVEAGIAEDVLQGAFYAGKLYAYLSKEWDDGPDVWVTGFLTDQKSLAAGNLRIDHLVRTTVTTRRKALHPLGKTEGILSLRTFLFRPWVGESRQDTQADDTRVYVFPKYGERYHAYGCRIMKEGSVEAILTEQLKRKYAACKTCRPSSLPYGSLVFLFSDGSRVYHRKECPCITKYYVSMPKGEAVAEGYTPCLFCQEGL